jgi:hypothetical protein
MPPKPNGKLAGEGAIESEVDRTPRRPPHGCFSRIQHLASSEASRDRQARCQAVRGESLIFPHVEDPADCPLDLFYSE